MQDLEIINRDFVFTEELPEAQEFVLKKLIKNSEQSKKTHVESNEDAQNTDILTNHTF